MHLIAGDELIASGPDADWVPLLMRMIQVSVVGFAIGGAFLGLLHYDFPWYLVALVVMVGATVEENLRSASRLPARADTMGPSFAKTTATGK